MQDKEIDFVGQVVSGDVAGILIREKNIGKNIELGDLLIIDDPHSEQDALSEAALENAYEWYTSGPRQRLQPGGQIVCVMTR